ncbi:uncharacterized protein N7483_002844, partial [Penicillium malachiteum]|uniref:uncharacterized protein n=1 Tax=Penicillium malachiteum TaxID=1324776 RepID=UPI002546E0B0
GKPDSKTERLKYRRFLMAFSLTAKLWVGLFIAGTAIADQENRFRSEKYAHALEGQYVTQHYSSFAPPGPVLNYWEKSPACDDGLYTIISPRGGSVHHSGPMILDNDGHMVWFRDYKSAYNANVHTYKGERYLTFWAGDDLVRGHGEGTLYMLNSNYEEKYKIENVQGRRPDLHEFQITRDDTAIFTVYDVRGVDLTSVGGTTGGFVYDSAFYEVDIETNKLLFEWRASQHFDYSESLVHRGGNGDAHRHPWDWFHINSVDKDEYGNYLISSRYLGCLIYIDGSTKETLWRLGGPKNSFTDLSDGGATNISWQHHARFHPSYDSNTTRAVSLFDNGSRGREAPENPSRGLFLDLDLANMTASIREQYWNPLLISTQSQGSMQIMDNGHVFVGYGYDAAWTEFGANGEVLCDVHFGPRDGFGRGAVISYRAYKQEWVGRPLTLPDVALSGTTASVSWNGATEVVTWVLQGSSSIKGEDPSPIVLDTTDWDADGRHRILGGLLNHGGGKTVQSSRRDVDSVHLLHDKDFQIITAAPKSGFETKIPIPAETQFRTLRIVALNKDGTALAATRPMKWDPVRMNEEVAVYRGDQGQDEDGTSSSRSRLAIMFGVGFITAAVILLCAWIVYKYIPSGFWCMLLQVNNRREQKWQPVNTTEELDALNELSNLESGEPESEDAALLKGQETGEKEQE